MAMLALYDWSFLLPAGSEMKMKSLRDFVFIETSKSTYIGLVILGILNVAYKLVDPMEVFEHGVFADFILDDISFAKLSILPKTSLSMNLTSNPLQVQWSLPPNNITSSSNAMTLNIPNMSEIHSNSQSNPLADRGFISDPLDPNLNIYYQQLSTTYEDLDLWTAFLSAMTLAAVYDKSAKSAEICIQTFILHYEFVI